MMGLRMADLVFRMLMGAIFLGWFAFMFSVNAEYREAEAEARAIGQKSSQSRTTFADESYDPMAVRSDPYATVYERPVLDDAPRDDVTFQGGDWGN
jgi:hypothetical protein